jgi:hypothetical protein
VRYLVRRLRRILPEGATVLVGYWADNGGGAALKALKATAEADAYATSLKEAALFCIEAARSHDTVATEAPKSETAEKDDKALAKENKTPAKNEKTPARVA